MSLKTTKREHAHVINSPIYVTIRRSDLASTLRVQFALSCLVPSPLSFERSNSPPFILSKRVKVLHRFLLKYFTSNYSHSLWQKLWCLVLCKAFLPWYHRKVAD